MNSNVGNTASSSFEIKEEKAQKLLAAYCQGDGNAFTELYNLYIIALLNYGSCFTVDRELVKDCVHDVFVELLIKCRKYPIKRVGSYLIIALRNRLLDVFRRNVYTVDTPITDYKLGKCDEGVENRYIRQEREERIHDDVDHLFAELTPRQQLAFQLHFIEQKDYEEICGILKMNYSCVRNLVHRGMVKVRSSEAYKNMKPAMAKNCQ